MSPHLAFFRRKKETMLDSLKGPQNLKAIIDEMRCPELFRGDCFVAPLKTENQMVVRDPDTLEHHVLSKKTPGFHLHLRAAL
jgi:hypothetical protein